MFSSGMQIVRVLRNQHTTRMMHSTIDMLLMHRALRCRELQLMKA